MGRYVKPAAYRMTLRKRQDILNWVLGENGWQQRSYDRRTWLFCFDVKLHDLELDFESLLRHWQSPSGCGDEKTQDPDWIAGCREKWAQLREHQDGLESLGQAAIEDARRYFTGREGQHYGKPDDGGWNQLYDGTPVDAEFAFFGRQGGWLTLTHFEGRLCTDNALGSALRGEDDYALDGRLLRKLYQYLLMLRHDVSAAKATAEVEHQAAFNFFENYCQAVPSPAEQRALRIAEAERKAANEKAFLAQLCRGSGRRVCGPVSGGSENAAEPGCRRRVLRLADLMRRPQC